MREIDTNNRNMWAWVSVCVCVSARRTCNWILFYWIHYVWKFFFCQVKRAKFRLNYIILACSEPQLYTHTLSIYINTINCAYRLFRNKARHICQSTRNIHKKKLCFVRRTSMYDWYFMDTSNNMMRKQTVNWCTSSLMFSNWYMIYTHHKYKVHFSL